ncbi:MAG: GNAT family protein [Saprospiraceae bacterium]|nr:GNAT family protein [Saprospiraceae bacterium]
MTPEPFDFGREYVLEDDFARLQPLTVADYDHLLPFALQEPEIWTHTLVAADSPEKLKTYIAQALKYRVRETAYPFIVFDKRQDRYAGSTRFYHIDLKNGTTHLGYTWYGKAHQGTGLNRHCKFLMLDFAFQTMRMERVEFNADVQNERSIAAMKKIGCTVEGVLRSHKLLPDGRRRDSIVLSILREEWLSGVREQLRLRC